MNKLSQTTFSESDMKKAYEAGRSDFKKEALKELNEFSHVSAYPHILRSINEIKSTSEFKVVSFLQNYDSRTHLDIKLAKITYTSSTEI